MHLYLQISSYVEHAFEGGKGRKDHKTDKQDYRLMLF